MTQPVSTTHTRFFERFDSGKIITPGLPRITTDESISHFPERDDGLEILFIHAPIREWAYPNIMPIGHGYVASTARMDGHRIDVLDLNAARLSPVKDDERVFERWIDTEIENKLQKSKPTVIGIGGIITQFSRLKRIAEVCKKICPQSIIVLGGGIASSMPEFMLQRMTVDVCVLEEGEATISELLFRIEKGLSLKGLLGVAYRDYQRDGSFSVISNGLRPSFHSLQDGLDEVPWPMRRLWPIDEVYKKNPVGHLNWKTKWADGASDSKGGFSVSMIASRGCPYAKKACDYCYAAYLGANYRLRSPKEVVDEMQYLGERYGATYIHFLDDLLLTDHRWGLELCRELRERRRSDGFEVTWGGTCRTNIIANDIIRAKKEGRPNILEQAFDVGMRQAAYGVETGSPTVLKAIDKSGQTPDKIRVAIKETQRVFGYADCSFMIGSPGETRETVRETVDLCREIGLNPEVFFFTTAYPATSFWQLALDKGLILKAVTGVVGPADDDIIEEYLIMLGEQGENVRTNFSDLPDEEVVELSWWAVRELGAQNTLRHPHTGDLVDINAVTGATHASI